MTQTAPLASEASDSLDARFEAFVVEHRDRAVRLAWRLVGGDGGVAEDVAQDAFVAAHRSLHRFRGDAKLSTWFYRILVRKAHDHRRWRAVRQLWTGADVDVPDPATAPPGDPGLRRRIATALEALTRRQREAFVLVHLEGFSMREAADLLHAREGTIKSHVHRAVRRLRQELADIEPTGDQR